MNSAEDITFSQCYIFLEGSIKISTGNEEDYYVFRRNKYESDAIDDTNSITVDINVIVQILDSQKLSIKAVPKRNSFFFFTHYLCIFESLNLQKNAR